MTGAPTTPGVDGIGEVVDTLRTWQHDDAPIQLHPGDLGWCWQFGAEATAAALRVWRRRGDIVAVGMLDAPDVLRMTVAPAYFLDDGLARQLVADLADPTRGVLPAGTFAVEAPNGSRVQEELTAAGWDLGEPWTPLIRDLAEPVEESGVRIEVIGADEVGTFTAVHRAAWESERFTDELWLTMAGGLPFADGRSLLARDGDGVPVAGVTVWSAGPGRPGLLEPMGVPVEHRRHGYGRAICLAAAAHLRAMGASSARVCTTSDRVAAVATYESAGFVRQPERLDRSRHG